MSNKKRRDKEHDSSPAERITKIGKTTLATGAGVVLLRNTKFGKIARDGFSTAIKTGKGISKDLKGKNSRDMRNIKSAFDKHIGKNGRIIKDRYNKEKNKKGFKFTEKNTELLRKRKTIKQWGSSKGYSKLSETHTNITKRKLAKDIAEIYESRNLGKDAAEQIVQGVFNQVDSSGVIEGGMDQLLTKTFAHYNLDGKDKETIVNTIIETKRKLDTDLQSIKKGNEEFIDKITDHALNNIDGYKRNDKTIYTKLDKLVNKNFGKQINSEVLLTGGRKATVEDLVNYAEKHNLTADEFKEVFTFNKGTILNSKDRDKKEQYDFLADLRKQLDENSDFKNVILDKSIKINKDGELYSTHTIDDFISERTDWFKETLPGKILLKGLDDKNNIPDLMMFSSGRHAIGSGENGELENPLMYIMGKAYNITKSGDTYNINLDEGIDVKLVSGHKRKTVSNLLGSPDYYTPEAYTGKLSEKLDFNRDGETNILNRLERLLGKYSDPNWTYNAINDIEDFYFNTDSMGRSDEKINSMASMLSQNTGIDFNKAKADLLIQINRGNKHASNLMNKNIIGINEEAMKAIVNDSDTPEYIKKMFNVLDNEGVVEFFNHIEGIDHSFSNKGLTNFLTRYQRDSASTLNFSSSIFEEGSKFLPMEVNFDSKHTLNLEGQLRVELAKEIIMSKKMNGDEIFSWIDDLDISDFSNKLLKDTTVTSLFDKYVNTLEGDVSASISQLFERDNGVDKFSSLLFESGSKENSFGQHFFDMLESIKDKSRYKDNYIKNMNEAFYDSESLFTPIKKSSALDIISVENENIKINGDKAKEFLRELNAGRKDPNNISEFTIGLQYSLDRLSYGIGFGLGLGDESTSSPLDTIKNIGLKRVMPVALGMTALSYLDYEAENFTGTSLKGAAANAIANVDLTARQLLYKTKIGNTLNSIAESSVLHEYWFGQRHFNDMEEQVEWYENGYTPVRKGRYWGFGSSNEFRGNDITYYQPNYLKRAHSNYHDVSVYGSVEEKWKHSWIPTPRHLLSPLRAALDPYWLEKKHLEEGDRPYPVTGKLFDEGTAWGTILNPTIGEIIKPVKMLPEVKRRLNNKRGTDSVAILENLNNRIKNRGNRNDDLLVVEGTDIRNAEYVAYGNPTDSEYNISIYNEQPVLKGYGYMDGIEDIQAYRTPDGITYSAGGKYGQGNHQLYSSKKIDTFVQQAYGDKEVGTLVGNAVNMLKKINEDIITKGQGIRSDYYTNSNSPDRNTGTFIYKNLVNDINKTYENYYSQQEYNTMANRSVLRDYGRDLIHSQKQIHGMYGFLADTLTDDGSYSYRYENASQMTSFSRKFWDASLGGLGGGPMEIARRFFPSTDKSRVDINPLKNSMEDWLPDNYKYGDPYTSIPKGEMRLPGRGYETLNKLHPDEFGNYGAFDRFKILADIAPGSDEYKKWKSIAQNTVTDPDLKRQMEDIAARTAKVYGQHEFFEYKYYNNNTKIESGIIKQVTQNGEVELVSGTKLSLAGLNLVEDQLDVAREMLAPGKKITYKTYKDIKVDQIGNATIDAVIYDKGNNINKDLIDEGVATANKEDYSVLSVAGRQSEKQEVIGAAIEFIAHAKLPFVHNKWMKVESALESYKNENVYGSNFKTWDNPVRAFLNPAFNEESSMGLAKRALATTYGVFHFTKIAGQTSNNLVKLASNTALMTLSPAATAGATLGFITNMGTGVGKSNGAGKLKTWEKGMAIGATIGNLKWAYDNADNPLIGAGSFSLAALGLKHSVSNLETIAPKLAKFSDKKIAAIGAGIGLGVSALKNSHFDKDKMFGKWIPENTKKKWELDEYFDRLEYIKYQGLYKVASMRAAIFEGSNIRQIFSDLDRNKKKIAKLNRKAMRLAEKYNGNTAKAGSELTEIQNKIMSLEEQQRMFFKGGKYTKAAVAYKKKMESTVYGLSETATKDELLASVPDQYKDHFKAFMDITDKKERKKIMKYVPDYLKRPLQIAWGEKPTKTQSNSKYFNKHKLPTAAWKGWKPNVNLKHVKMKTIQNEGLLMSDFGYYESEKSKASYENAPSIEDFDNGNSSLLTKINLTTALNGLGVHTQNVSVEPTSAPGMWIVADVVNTAQDVGQVASYKASNLVNGMIKTIF